MNANSQKGPLCKLVNVNSVPKAGREIILQASRAQRAALADAHGLVSVEQFEAELDLRPWKKDGFRLTGDFSAQIVQECVVTLEPLPASISERVDIRLVPDDSPLLPPPDSDSATLIIDADAPDPPEPFAGGLIDVGGLVEQIFALSLDPYPRKEGVVFEDSAEGSEDDRPPSPFAKLASIANKP